MPKRKAKKSQTSADKQGKRARQQDGSSAKVKDNGQGMLIGECKTNIEKENQRMKDAYGMMFPEDFFRLWDFCQQIDEQNPKEVFRECGGLVLSGPYDFLAGNVSLKEATQYHLHSRHYYDPPEFMTVLEVEDYEEADGFHIGYWRDDPGSLPTFVASNRSLTNGQFSICGDNLFAAIYIYLQSMEKEKKLSNTVKDLMKKLKMVANSLHLTLDAVTPGIKKRKKDRVVSAAFHQVGICVPLSEEDVGYRPLTLTDSQLRKLLDRISKAQDNDVREAGFDELYEMVTLIQFANDESDYGMGLEFGLDLFTYGGEVFHKTILNTLPLAYELLDRHLYADIVRSHLEQRTTKPHKVLDE